MASVNCWGPWALCTVHTAAWGWPLTLADRAGSLQTLTPLYPTGACVRGMHAAKTLSGLRGWALFGGSAPLRASGLAANPFTSTFSKIKGAG